MFWLAMNEFIRHNRQQYLQLDAVQFYDLSALRNIPWSTHIPGYSNRPKNVQKHPNCPIRYRFNHVINVKTDLQDGEPNLELD